MPSYFPSSSTRTTRFGWERRRHPDPLSYLLDRYARSLDTPFGKRPSDWTTADFDALGEVLAEWRARERGRRRRRDSGDDDDEFEPMFEGRRGSGRRRRRDDGDDDEFEPMFEGRRESGRDRNGDQERDMRELLALLRARDQGRRLEGVENAVYGSPAERREAAFRERLRNVLHGRGGGGDEGEGGRHYGGGGGGWGQGTRMAQQEKDLERREREQRDREVEELRRELDRLRDERDRERGPWW